METPTGAPKDIEISTLLRADKMVDKVLRIYMAKAGKRLEKVFFRNARVGVLFSFRNSV